MTDAVAQQSDGHVRFEFLLNRAQHVQGGPAQDSHDGRRVSAAHAAVVLAELHVQGAVQPILDPPVAADQFQLGRRVRGPAGDVVAHGTLPPAGSVAFRLHADQAAQAGPRFGVRDRRTEAGAAQHGPDAPLGVVEGRLHLPVQGAPGCA